MDQVTRERLFDSILTASRLGKGAGLGLATVAAIIQQNGGELQVASEPGCGTTIKVYLPRVGRPPQQAEGGQAGSPAPANS